MKFYINFFQYKKKSFHLENLCIVTASFTTNNIFNKISSNHKKDDFIRIFTSNRKQNERN